jgi:predicted ATPase/DNA-binding CsgD family transcriptional regulator
LVVGRGVTTAGAGALTARERDVAAAVRSGLANKAIARQLGVSMKTIEFHLGNIYRKLGITSKVQLANAVTGQWTPGPNNSDTLPVNPSLLIGRDDELARVEQAIDQHPLVTLIGFGGVGKTRLAVETARRTADRFDDGVWFVDLAAITDVDQVLAACVDVLRIKQLERVPTADDIADALGRQRRLIILDNCEHVLDAARPLADAISRRCPYVMVLATSRERLDVSAEHVLVVPPVSCERDGRTSPATDIFVGRSVRMGRIEEFTDSELDDIHEICRGLDGVPLAIELAAGRLGGMSVSQIRTRLDDRFALLVNRGSAHGRHHSLMRTIEWSYDLLAADERTLLAALSVFAGDFDADAAAAVNSPDMPARTSEDLLASLVEQSLVTAIDRGARRRFLVLDSVRAFASTQVDIAGGDAVVRRRHLDHFLALAGVLEQRLRGRDELEAHRAMSDDWHNLRLAEASACAIGDGPAACQLISDVLWWALTRRRTEVADWAERAIAVPSSEQHSARTVALAACAFFTFLRGNREAAARLLGEARDWEARHGELPDPWITVVGTFWANDSLATAGETQHRARRFGSRFWETVGILQEAVIRANYLSHTDRSRAVDVAVHLERINRANTMAEELGNPNGIAYGAATLGEALSRVDPVAAERLLTRAIDNAVPLELGILTSQARRALAQLWLHRGQPADALVVLASALRESVQSGSMVDVDVELAISAKACAVLGDTELAEVIRLELDAPTDRDERDVTIVELARRVIATAAAPAYVAGT